jgi:hypothetical protein
MMGHSQGGQAVLAAHSFAKSYGMSGQLIGVLAYAPLWFSPRAWAGLIDPTQTQDTQTEVLYGMYYFYSHAMLYDGSLNGIFQTAQVDTVKGLIFENDCFWADPTLNGKQPADYYDPNFVAAVSGCGTGFGTCSGATADTWVARFAADRPALDANGPPVVIWTGGKDSLITPGFAECAMENLNAGLGPSATTSLTSCVDANATHPSILGSQEDWGNQWIAHAVGITTTAPSCTAFQLGANSCTVPPPNM